MARLFALAVLLAACAAPASAAFLRTSRVPPSPYQLPSLPTNICRLEYNYCPRDPGCKTYTMSVHDVKVHAAGYAEPVKSEDLKVGDVITLTVTGITTIKSVPTAGSYRIYSLAGHNVAAGALSDVFTLNAPNFEIVAQFTLDADVFGPAGSGWFEFGLDVFQKGSGSDEGMCLEVESIEYATYEENDPSPPFVMYCKDNGDGTFTPDTHAIEPKPVPSPACNEPGTCDLKWDYCPRDPGCVTYTMSVSAVALDVMDPKTIKVGDPVHLVINGTTSIKKVPTAGSFRIYDLAGHNAFAGVLSEHMTLGQCGVQGCYFNFEFSFAMTADMWGPSSGPLDGSMEFGLDVFQKGSGSDEGFCINVMNQKFVHYEETSIQPPPGFVTYCVDEGWGHFKKQTTPEKIFPVVCNLE